MSARRSVANIRKGLLATLLCAAVSLSAPLAAQTAPGAAGAPGDVTAMPNASLFWPKPPQSGRQFQSAATRALEDDEFAHPGLLWVEQGKQLAQSSRATGGKRCTDCHGDAAGQRSLRGVAATYPKWNGGLRKVLNLEQQINQCVTTHQQAPALEWESRELLALTAWVAQQSKGAAIKVDISGAVAPTWQRGEALYQQRIGQMNLACTHCHDRQWGKTLLAESISQGQPDGWPAYRLEWQSLASLQRRLRACFHGVRATQPAFGSEDLVALELYLAKRAEGLSMSAPGVRR